MRHIIITGATSGFGLLLVKLFIENGDTVLATGRKLSTRSNVFAPLKPHPRLIEIDMDLADASSRTAFRTFCQSFPKIDVLINNAGFGLFGAFEDCEDQQIRYQMEVNFFGLADVTKSVLPQLLAAQGKIFNLSSVFGFNGFPLTSFYCASKFAVEGLSESLRYELAPFGVQVTLIEPGAFKTRFGTSLIWGENKNPPGRFAKSTANYMKLRDRFSITNSADPRIVAEGIFKLAGKKKTPLRKVFGRDALTTRILRSITPGPLYHFLSQKVYNSIFFK